MLSLLLALLSPLCAVCLSAVCCSSTLCGFLCSLCFSQICWKVTYRQGCSGVLCHSFMRDVMMKRCTFLSLLFQKPRLQIKHNLQDFCYECLTSVNGLTFLWAFLKCILGFSTTVSDIINITKNLKPGVSNIQLTN